VAESSDLQSFAEHLRELRSRRAWSLERVAEDSGIDVTRLAGLESGSATPSHRELWRLARAFHVSGETMLVKAGQLRLLPG